MPPVYSIIIQRARNIARVDSDLVSRVADLENPTTTSQESECLTAAFREYCQDRPRVRSKRVTGTGAATYDLTVLVDGWDDETHQVTAIQYPLTEAQETLDDNAWNVALDIDTERPTLRFIDVQPGEDFGLRWIEPHELTVSTSSVPTKDYEMLAQLTAHHIIVSAASEAAKFTEGSTLPGDSVQYSTISGNYAERAKECRARYDAAKKKNPAPTMPTLVESDIEINPIFGSYARPSRYR